MIREELDNQLITYKCRTCTSINIVKNGTNRLGQQQYLCKDCGARRVLVSKREEQAKKKQELIPLALAACFERVSLRGVARLFNISRSTLMDEFIEYFAALPTLSETLLPAEPDDILEWDEAWSFVGYKKNKQWLWTVLCRRTRQIIGFEIGDRSQQTCQRLWDKIPEAYRQGFHFSDFWSAYRNVLPTNQHEAVGKESGETSHQERWYNTLRQWCGRYTRKTLSFSKCEIHHRWFTECFIIQYNLRIKYQMMSLT